MGSEKAISCVIKTAPAPSSERVIIEKQPLFTHDFTVAFARFPAIRFVVIPRL